MIRKVSGVGCVAYGAFAFVMIPIFLLWTFTISPSLFGDLNVSSAEAMPYLFGALCNGTTSIALGVGLWKWGESSIQAKRNEKVSVEAKRLEAEIAKRREQEVVNKAIKAHLAELRKARDRDNPDEVNSNW